MRRRAFIVALGGRSGVANRCPRSSWKYFFAAPKGRTCLSYSPPSLSWSSISRHAKSLGLWPADEIAGCEKNDEDQWPQNQREPGRRFQERAQ
jgi:hypothetical protein